MKWIRPSEINGIISAPASKSMMLRATAMALLCQGETHIRNHSECDDALSGLRVAEALGAQIIKERDVLKIRGGRTPRTKSLDCGESGLCMRMFTPIAGLYETKLTITGTGPLLKRPMKMVEHPLKQLGAHCRTNHGFPPVHVQGPIKGGQVRIDGSISSQVLTGLLIALPLCPNDSEVTVDHLKSKPYVQMTLSLLGCFGIVINQKKEFYQYHIPGAQLFKSPSLEVEGDWSGASFLLVAGAIKGRASIRNLKIDSSQADKGILKALKAANAKISIANDMVTVERSDLKAFQFDATECPDLFPPLAVLASFCRGQSALYGVERLKHKESNRAQTLSTELTKIGAQISVEGNKMTITGTHIKGGTLESRGDHRIAMAGAVAGLNSRQGVGIQGWECISKSYPHFFRDLESLGGDLK